MGWRNDTFGTEGKPVEMTFEFDSVRNFSAIVLHTNNMFTKDVQVSRLHEIRVLRGSGNPLNHQHGNSKELLGHQYTQTVGGRLKRAALLNTTLKVRGQMETETGQHTPEDKRKVI